MPLPEIIVYSKPSCCLCEKVRSQLAKLRETHEFTWREVNILEDAAAYEKFQHEIPVIFVNGRKSFKYHLNEKQLIGLLKTAAPEVPEEGVSAPRLEP